METMTGVNISIDIKNREFYLADPYMFILITEEGEQNQICLFDDEITDRARKYADELVPKIFFYNCKEKKDYIKKERVDYWSKLFHLHIWKLLAEKNTVTYMKAPYAKII